MCFVVCLFLIITLFAEEITFNLVPELSCSGGEASPIWMFSISW